VAETPNNFVNVFSQAAANTVNFGTQLLNSLVGVAANILQVCLSFNVVFLKFHMYRVVHTDFQYFPVPKIVQLLMVHKASNCIRAVIGLNDI